MNRRIKTMIVIILVMCLCGCASNANKQEETSTSPEPAQTTTNVETTTAYENETNNSDELCTMGISGQEGLDSALSEKYDKLTKIQFSCNDEGLITIPKGNYSNVILEVNAPLADVENYGSFERIEILAIANDTWTEHASGNEIHLIAEHAHIIVAEDAKVDTISCEQQTSSPNYQIEVYGIVEQVTIENLSTLDLKVDGTVNDIVVNDDANINLSGESTDEISVISKDENVQIEISNNSSIVYTSTVKGSSEDSSSEVSSSEASNTTASTENTTVEETSSKEETVATSELPAFPYQVSSYDDIHPYVLSDVAWLWGIDSPNWDGRSYDQLKRDFDMQDNYYVIFTYKYTEGEQHASNTFFAWLVDMGLSYGNLGTTDIGGFSGARLNIVLTNNQDPASPRCPYTISTMTALTPYQICQYPEIAALATGVPSTNYAIFVKTTDPDCNTIIQNFLSQYGYFVPVSGQLPSFNDVIYVTGQ